jgi:hypothetical protein
VTQPAPILPCRSCGAPIYFVRTERGKLMPMDAETGETHFATCPQAKQWSKSVQRRVAAQTEP